MTTATTASPQSTQPIYPFPTPVSAPYPTAVAASIYVGELHPEVTESVLFELFNQVGPVNSIRICRDAVTKKSLGYGYVNFHATSDAERALDVLNYTVLKDKPIRLMWSQRDPSLRRAGSGNIFIKDLDKEIDNKALHDTFSAFGNILSCKVCCDENGSKGYGYVHFETQEAANEAIAKVNGMLLNDKKVFVGPHLNRKERVSKVEQAREKFTNVFVKNLNDSLTKEEFHQLFAPFGEISSLDLPMSDNNKNKGFGFVNFVSVDSAHKAVEQMNNKDLNGKVLFVGRAQKKEERSEQLRQHFEQLKLENASKFQGVNVFVKNLDESIDDEKLNEVFAPCGTISSCKVMRDEKGNSKCFGFVCFGHKDEATRAIAELNGKLLIGKPIFVGPAQRKDERKALLEQQFIQRAQMRMQAVSPMFPGNPLYFASQQRPQQYVPMVARPIPSQMRPPFMNQQYAAVPQQRGGIRPPRMVRPAGPVRAVNPAGLPKGRGGPRSMTASGLANLTLSEQKQTIGEQLFVLVRDRQQAEDVASKITGMLLEMDIGELLHLIESPDALDVKVKEAVEALREHAAASKA